MATLAGKAYQASGPLPLPPAGYQPGASTMTGAWGGILLWGELLLTAIAITWVLYRRRFAPGVTYLLTTPVLIALAYLFYGAAGNAAAAVAMRTRASARSSARRGGPGSRMRQLVEQPLDLDLELDRGRDYSSRRPPHSRPHPRPSLRPRRRSPPAGHPRRGGKVPKKTTAKPAGNQDGIDDRDHADRVQPRRSCSPRWGLRSPGRTSRGASSRCTWTTSAAPSTRGRSSPATSGAFNPHAASEHRLPLHLPPQLPGAAAGAGGRKLLGRAASL